MVKTLILGFLMSVAYVSTSAQTIHQLFVPKKDYNAFLLVTDSIAYYKFRRIDKPSYFMDEDTLFMLRKGYYKGKTCIFQIGNGNYLTFDGGKSFEMVLAPKKRIEKWNYYNNFDLLSALEYQVRKKRDSIAGIDQYRMLNRDWDLLFQCMSNLDVITFKKKVEDFLNQYGITE